ncbi:hypothetical protein ACWD4V_28820 [Streptomyces tsukubensis]
MTRPKPRQRPRRRRGGPGLRHFCGQVLYVVCVGALMAALALAGGR